MFEHWTYLALAHMAIETTVYHFRCRYNTRLYSLNSVSVPHLSNPFHVFLCNKFLRSQLLGLLSITLLLLIILLLFILRTGLFH